MDYTLFQAHGQQVAPRACKQFFGGRYLSEGSKKRVVRARLCSEELLRTALRRINPPIELNRLHKLSIYGFCVKVAPLERVAELAFQQFQNLDPVRELP